MGCVDIQGNFNPGVLYNAVKDGYLVVFENAENRESIRVLDLYVYRLGIGNGSIPLSTVVGMFKSVISVILLKDRLIIR